MSERTGDKNVADEMLKVLRELAGQSPDRIVTVAQALQAVREKNWDYDDSDAIEAFSYLLAHNLVRLGQQTSTLIVPTE